MDIKVELFANGTLNTGQFGTIYYMTTIKLIGTKLHYDVCSLLERTDYWKDFSENKDSFICIFNIQYYVLCTDVTSGRAFTKTKSKTFIDEFQSTKEIGFEKINFLLDEHAIQSKNILTQKSTGYWRGKGQEQWI